MANNIGQGASMPVVGQITGQNVQFVNAIQGGQLQNNAVQVNQALMNAKVNQANSADTQLISKPRLQELVREVNPTAQIDEEVEEMLLQLADDFIDSTLNAACAIAKHRHSPTVELRDVQLHLERQWNMWIPGFGNEELKPYKRAVTTEAHRQRLALLRKAMKKY